MADLDRYLRRFRRLVAPPGRAAPIGVPVDRAAILADELTDVFQAIDDIQAEAERIRAAAKESSERELAQAGVEAGRIVSAAREQAEEERASEAARHRQDVERDAEAGLARAREEAEAIRARADARMDELSGRIVDRLIGNRPAEAG